MTVHTSEPVDGFRLTYEIRTAAAPPEPGPHRAAVLLHGWPGDRTDYRATLPLLDPAITVVVPDLRGFGDSDRHPVDPTAGYSATAQARSIAGLIAELGLSQPVVAGYDIGSRVAQTLATEHPDHVGRLVLSPPLPGLGSRVLNPLVQSELWYMDFHRSELAAELLDGNPAGIRQYLEHFWNQWSGPDFQIATSALEHLTTAYARPGAFTSAIAWYRAGPGMVASALAETPPAPSKRVPIPTSALWPEHDPIFPRAWSDRLGEFFSDVHLVHADGVGHFTPVEAPNRFAELISHAAAAT
jgi:pimeloyl-ACP methyl ester carboxylesterase